MKTGRLLRKSRTKTTESENPKWIPKTARSQIVTLKDPTFKLKERIMKERQYLLKIRLMDIEPEIWRRFVVPSDITLDRLHDVIQIVMGWEDYHMHEFIIGKKRYTEIREPEEQAFEEGLFSLGDLMKQKGRYFDYRYDFGDGWEHEITLEQSRYLNPQLQAPIECLEGERACPPEDVGGVPGYYDLCEAMKTPGHEEYESSEDWYGGEFESEAYDPEEVNYELMKYLRWSRDRIHPWKGKI
jgi:hypothetical protein